MSHGNILITGGAGFIGSNLALFLRERLPSARIVALDSLKRRGSELNLSRLAAAGIGFVHGDIRVPSDLEFGGEPFDLVIECSAEPSVLAGYDRPAYVVETNLTGTVHCLELARRHKSDLIFLSTSRVYPIEAQRSLKLVETETRFELAARQDVPGVSPAGISEGFPLTGARSLYGATKLASELLVEEYRAASGIRTIINRCGVVAGPWQMGKVDQGVFSLWLLMHLFERPLRYIGFGGTGKQVRDLLHVADLCELVWAQMGAIETLSGSVFNAGGGRGCSLSLQETTEICRRLTGNSPEIARSDEERAGDVPVYLTDNARVTAATGWSPQATPEQVLSDILEWARPRAELLKAALLG